MTFGTNFSRLRVCVAAMICGLAASVYFVPVSSATGTLDQQNAVSLGSGYTVGFGFSPAQSFTVGLTGELTEVGVTVWNGGASGPLIVQVTQLSGGEPDLSHVVANGSVPSSSVGSSYTDVIVPLTP